MSLNNSLNNGVKEARTNNGEGLSPSRCPVGEQRRPGRHRHQTTARKECTKEDNKFAITCYLTGRGEGQRRYRKGMHQYCIEEGRFEIEVQHQACQVRSILKIEKLSEVEIDALGQKVTTTQETLGLFIENGLVEDFDVTDQIGVEQNHPAADGGMERTDELHRNEDTQRIRRMMQENSRNPIPSRRGIDALKVKSTVSEINDMICNIRVKNLDELENLLGAGTRLVCNKAGVIANKKVCKETY